MVATPCGFDPRSRHRTKIEHVEHQMKVGFRLTLDGKVYVGQDHIFESDQEFEEFLNGLETNRAKTISSIIIEPGEDGVAQGISAITLNIGKDAADRVGVFLVHYKPEGTPA